MIVKIFRKVLSFVYPIIFWLLVWEGISLIVGREILLPSPVSVIGKLCKLFFEVEFHMSVLLTLIRVLGGYVLGVISGALLAVVAFYSKPVESLLSPLFTVIRATPVASFIILALVWIGRNLIPSFTAFLMVMPIVYNSTLTGIASADRELSEVAYIFEFSKLKKLRLLYLPSAVPFFISGTKTSLGLAWKSGVAAEVLCALKYSIGGEIYNSKLYLETTELMAWTLCVIILSLILEIVISSATSLAYKKIYSFGD